MKQEDKHALSMVSVTSRVWESFCSCCDYCSAYSHDDVIFIDTFKNKNSPCCTDQSQQLQLRRTDVSLHSQEVKDQITVFLLKHKSSVSIRDSLWLCRI